MKKQHHRQSGRGHTDHHDANPSNDHDDGGVDGQYPEEELEWLATTTFNRAIDFYCASDEVACKRWAERALTLAGLFDDVSIGGHRGIGGNSGTSGVGGTSGTSLGVGIGAGAGAVNEEANGKRRKGNTSLRDVLVDRYLALNWTRT